MQQTTQSTKERDRVTDQRMSNRVKSAPKIRRPENCPEKFFHELN